jgi:hypothetical protein
MSKSRSALRNSAKIKGSSSVEQSSARKKGSTGPRTSAGKRRSCRNSRTHGIFVRALQLSPEERTEYDALQAGFEDDLEPDSPLEYYLFQDVVTNGWRIQMATRCELGEIRRLLREKEGTSPSESMPDLHFPYDLTPSELRRRIDLLNDVDSCPGGYLTRELQESVTRAFGVEFCQILTGWTAADSVMMMMFRTMRFKEQTYKLEPMADPPSPEDEAKCAGVDIQIREQYRRKLVAMERGHLMQALAYVQRASTGATGAGKDRLELFLRYQTSARRDFYRALREYRATKWPKHDSDDE